MKRMRKTASFLLILSLVFGLIPMPFGFAGVTEVQAATVSEALSGTCGANGNNITWKLTVDTDAGWDLAKRTPYKLTLTGSGAMADYSNYDSNRPPWYNNRGTITSISIGGKITTIGDYAFYEFASLKTLKLPDSVTSVGYAAVSSCHLLETIVCGTGLKTVKNYSFSSNSSLTDVQLNNGLKEIDYRTFYCCIALEEITIPDSVTTLGAESFYDTKIKSITIPQNVTTIEDEAFSNCSFLNKIQVAAKNPYFFVQDNVLLYEKKNGTPYRAVAYAIASEAKTVSIADGTEIIGASAFSGARYLTSVTFPDMLKTIGHGAFSNCTSITELNIPDSVETIGSDAFWRCISLTTLHIGKGLNKWFVSFERCTALSTITISEENPYLDAVENVIYNKEHTILYLYAAAKPETVYHILDTVDTLYGACITNTSFLKELYMPESLNDIRIDAVYDNQTLNSIYFPGDAPTRLWSDSMHSNAKNLILYRLPSASGWDAEIWKNFLLAEWDPDNPILGEGSLGKVSWKYEGTIGRISFTGPGAIPDFTLENPAPWNDYMAYIQTIEAEKITDIGNYSFYDAEKLLRLEADEALNRVGNYAFAGCRKQVFTDITAIDTIGISAFQNNDALRGSLILEKVSSIGSSAFRGCVSLQDAIIGACLTTLEKEVFADCTALNRFIIPESVSMIKTGAFQGCSSLRTINIPAGVNTIGSRSFSGDSALEKVYFYGKIPTNWADDSFEDCNSSLTLYYRKTETDWNRLGASWNDLPLTGLDRFYTERKDHYSFSNSPSSFGYPAKYRIPRQRYVDVLDDIIYGSYWYAVDGEWYGSCYGMTASTLEFYENPDFNVKDYAPSAGNLYAVTAPRNKNSELTKLIEAYQISQYTTSISGYNGDIAAHMRDYKGLIQKVEEFERSGGLGIDSEAEPVVMLIYSIFGGHAVIPVSVTQIKNGDFQLKVYDPDYPSALRTLTIYKDFSRISYGMYTYASYANYNTIAKDMSGVHLYSDARDASLYLAIDKEYGKVTNTDGMGIDGIEGAYENKHLSAENEDTFSGIKRFVLPEGNYQLTTDIPEDASETTNPGSVTFYLASEDCFAEITSSDEDAVLNVTETGIQDGSLVMELQSDSQTEETVSFTLVNPLGMERTVETDSGNTTVTLGDDNEIIIQAPDRETIFIDGQELTLTDGQAASSFVAGEEENPLKTSGLETDITCNQKNFLTGTVNAEVISNDADEKEVAVRVEFFENGAAAASWSGKKTLNPGRNMVSLAFEELETDFRQTIGDVALSCKFTVTDENGDSAAFTGDGISVSLTRQEQPDDSESEKPDTTNPDISGGSGDSSGSGNSGNSSGSGSSGGSSGSGDSGNSSGSGSSGGSSSSGSSGSSSSSGNTNPAVTDSNPADSTNSTAKPSQNNSSGGNSPVIVTTAAPSPSPSPSATPSLSPSVEPSPSPSTTVEPDTDLEPVVIQTPIETPEPVITPETEEPSDTVTKSSVPKKGQIKTVGKLKYIVTKSSKKNGTVAVYSAKKKNAAKVVIPKKVKINGYAFKVTGIRKNAFSNMKKLSQVTLGANVKTIGNNAFKNCGKLQFVIIPNKVTAIGKEAFAGCTKLMRMLVKSDKIKSAGNGAFRGVNPNIIVKTSKKKWKQYSRMFMGKGKMSQNALFIIDPVKLKFGNKTY